MQYKMLESFFSKMISREPKTFAPLFIKLTHTQDAKIKAEALAEINEKAYKMAQEATSQFSLSAEGINKAKFSEILSPVISNIEQVFINVKNDPERKSPNIEPKEAKAVIDAFFSYVENVNNPVCGQLMEDIAFKVGNFGGAAESVMQLMKDDLSQMMYGSMYAFRISHHAFVDSMVESLKSNKVMLGDMVTDALKNSDGAKADKTKKTQEEINAETETKFQEQIKKISALSHDYIFHSLGSMSGAFLMKPIAKLIVGKDAGKIDQVIKECYQKLFGEKFLNFGFLVKMQGIVFDELEKSKARMETKQKHLIHKVSGKI